MLESSLDRNNFERAAQAVRELKRLGVSVKFRGLVGKKLSDTERGLSKIKPTILGGDVS